MPETDSQTLKQTNIMYKTLLAGLTAITLTTLSYAQQKQEMKTEPTQSRILVASFSATGTTSRAAAKVAAATGGTLHAITPAQAYTAADLDWHDKRSRSSVEMDDPHARPALGGREVETAGYDVIFIGYPIWWNLAPRIINTFIERHDLRGKVLIPFATSGGNGISNSVAALKRSYPDLDWREGRLLNRAGDQEIRSWVAQLGIGQQLDKR